MFTVVNLGWADFTQTFHTSD